MSVAGLKKQFHKATQLPFASCLLEAILEKINEKKKLAEVYFTIMKDIR